MQLEYSFSDLKANELINCQRMRVALGAGSGRGSDTLCHTGHAASQSTRAQ